MARSRRPLTALLIVLALALVSGVVALVFYVGAIARASIETASSHATGTEVTVDSVDLRLIPAQLSVRGFVVANPSGFEARPFLSLRDARVSISLAELLSDTLSVNELVIDGVEVNLERRRRSSNYGEILERLEQLDAGAAAAEDEMRFEVKSLVIRDIKATARLIPFSGRLTEVTAHVPEFRMTNIGSEGQEPFHAGDVTRIVIVAVLEALASKGSGLPGEFRYGLRSSVEEVTRRISGGVGETGESVLGEVRDAAGKATRRALDGLGRLLGRERESDEAR